MRLSTRSNYGMRALIELGLASGFGPLSAAVIAKRQDLSVAYLEQLLHRLKRHGFIASVRGPRGGYVLAKEPRQITMAEVVHVLDGMNGAPAQARDAVRRLLSAGKSKAARSQKQATQRHAHLISEAVRHCVHERLAQSLSEVTLQNLCETVATEAGDPLEHRYVFHI